MIFGHRGPGWFPTSLPLFIILYALLYTTVLKGKSRSTKWRYSLLILYAFLLFDVTQAPFAFNQESFHHIKEYHTFRYNVVPFHGAHLLQFKLNILLFIPLGIIVTSIRQHYRWFNTLLLGLAVSCGIEILQLVTSLLSLNVRSFDVDDLITNTFGALIGYIIYRVAQRIQRWVQSRKSQA